MNWVLIGISDGRVFSIRFYRQRKAEETQKWLEKYWRVSVTIVYDPQPGDS